MKKYLSVLLAMSMLLAMTGCNSESGVTPVPDETTAESSSPDKTEAQEKTEATEASTKPEKPTSSAPADSGEPAETTASPSRGEPAATAAPESTDEPAVTTPAEPKPEATAAASTTYGPTDIGGSDTPEWSKEFDADLSEGFVEMDEEFSMADSLDGFIVEAPAAAGGTAGGDWCIECPVPDPGEPIIEEPYIQPSAGLLTGGEWRDNDHWADWLELYNSHRDWEDYKKNWRISTDCRIAVKVTSGGAPVEGAKVSCGSAANSAVTDNKGMAYLFYTAINGPTESITAEFGGASASADGVIGDASVEIELDGVSSASAKKLDFMIVCDTTGSMSDELEYLKEELKDIIRTVKEDNSNIPVRLSVNFYRDEGDEYVVREYPFTDDISAACAAVSDQSANGGGDTPEAVHTALDSAINKHDWDEDAVKIMFLVLDAPPHDDAQIIDSVNSYIAKAAEMGIRVIPVASSGIDKSTEYLLRVMAFTTGGTYTFLTSDSGIGGSHIEPTVGAFNVEKLNEMMIRIVNGYLS